jgi:hypothetical protein
MFDEIRSLSRIKTNIRLILVTASLACSGCVDPRAYQPMPYQHMAYSGISDQQLTADTWHIVARGNGYTHSERIHYYALLRAAEVTNVAGHTHFVIIGGEDATRLQQGQLPSQTDVQRVGNYVTVTETPGTQYSVTKPGKT